VVDAEPPQDAVGGRFIRFEVDERMGVMRRGDTDSWNKATITGCVYLDRKEVFIKKGDQYRPAAFLLGKNLKPAAAPTCQDATTLARTD
jgi:hypothetical protein